MPRSTHLAGAAREARQSGRVAAVGGEGESEMAGGTGQVVGEARDVEGARDVGGAGRAQKAGGHMQVA